MNSLVYPVDGSMEDWMYAAGWDKTTRQAACIGNQNNQTNRNSNSYSERDSGKAENRALVFLVETSDRKTPSTNTLGSSDQVQIRSY